MFFAEFWARYLDAHRMPATRAAHYIAAAVGSASAGAAIYEGQPLLMLGGLPLAIALAVGSHWLIEHNQPMFPVNALYGVVAGLKMCCLALIGGLLKECRLGLVD
jgi:hypothetical protein